MIGAAAVLLALGAASGAPATDFGIRSVGQAPAVTATAPTATASLPAAAATNLRLKDAAAVAAQWGRVTSTWRSLEHNRRVGGVRNSYHLSGRAIDVARAPNVSHARIEAALRQHGYRMVESLDEGDHSHFAFDFGTAVRALRRSSEPQQNGGTTWRIVTARR